MLKTASGSPYHFSFHAGDLGNTFICGPSGSGKTVLQNFLLAQAEKFGCQRVMFDKDRGAEIFVRASGGTYLTLKNGVPTGCAPLKALDLTPTNLAFLGELVRKLVTIEGRALSVVDEERIDSALEAMRALAAPGALAVGAARLSRASKIARASAPGSNAGAMADRSAGSSMPKRTRSRSTLTSSAST